MVVPGVVYANHDVQAYRPAAGGVKRAGIDAFESRVRRSGTP
jgi:hypothetical protein